MAIANCWGEFWGLYCYLCYYYFKCDQASDLWQQLELASKLESDLWDTVVRGRKWLVDFNAGKTQLVSFDWSNNTGAIDVKMDRSVLEKNHLLRCWGWLSLQNWTGAVTLPLLLKMPPGKLEPWLVRRCHAQPYSHVWNNAMFGLVHLVVSWNC